MAENMNRRRFFGSVVKISGAVLLAPAILNSLFTSDAFAQKKRGAPAGGDAGGGSATPLVNPADPVAKAVKYSEDHKKVAAAGANHCGNCGFYKKTETRDGKEVGTCTIFAGKVVLADAWCSSWNKKA